MDEVMYENQEIGMRTLVGVLFPVLPKLLFKFSITFLRFKRGAKKAGKIFRKELMKQGLDKQTASELTGLYMKSSEIKSYIQNFRWKFF